MFQVLFLLLALLAASTQIAFSSSRRSRNCRDLPGLLFIHLCRPDGITNGLCTRVSACSNIGFHRLAAKSIRV